MKKIPANDSDDFNITVVYSKCCCRGTTVDEINVAETWQSNKKNCLRGTKASNAYGADCCRPFGPAWHDVELRIRRRIVPVVGAHLKNRSADVRQSVFVRKRCLNEWTNCA
jgi:hypothetical protein